MHSSVAFQAGAQAAPPVVLGDGRRVAIAAVDARDEGAEREFVAALSLTSRYHRFHFGLRELSPQAAHEMTAVDQTRHVAFVARAIGDAAGAIVADARYVRQADCARAEFAVVVADAWQGRGLGRALIDRLLAHARRAGLRQLYGDVLWGNVAMLALLRGMGASLRRHPGDATMVRAEFALT